MAKVAFIGLGVMGGPMAGHLLKAGHDVAVYNRSDEKARDWVQSHPGGRTYSSVAGAVEGRADEKQRPRAGVGLPSSPRALPVTKALGNSKHRHQGAIEAQCAVKVDHANEHMRQHGLPPPLCVSYDWARTTYSRICP